ncbi:MAG: radical SAM protein [Bacteroidales bacterium]|nr:radical SAM protein [Bacteroidales bacterium]
MNISAIIKASTISNHFPDRHNSIFQGVSLIEFIILRLKQSKMINSIVLTTSQDDRDNVFSQTASKFDIQVYRGNLDDSIERLYGAACLTRSDVFIKILGNCPLIDPWEMDKLIDCFISNKYCYGYNEHSTGIILGLGTEIFTFDTLEKAHTQITDPVIRSFGSRAFKDVIDDSLILVRNHSNSRPNYRVSLAVPNDVLVINKIIEECEDLTSYGIMKYLDKNPILVKFAQSNISGSQEVGVEKILLFPDKLKSLNKVSYDCVDYSYPMSVELSLTNKCNLACKWCSDLDLRQKAMVDQDFSVIEALFKDLAEHGTKGIVIEGGGEPSLYSKFNEVLNCAKELGLHLGLITNGVDINYIDQIDSFDWIRVSLDAANRKQFLESKGKDCFDRVIGNIQKMISKSADDIIIGVGYVLTRNNEKDLEDIVLKLRRIRVNYFQIRPVIDHDDMRSKNNDLEYLTKHSTPMFNVSIHNMKENYIKGNSNLPCRTHSISSVICANGDVFLCGRLNKYDWFEPIGNLNHQSFYDIWNGSERQKQAEMVFKSEFCGKWCPECRLTKYNKVLGDVSKIKTVNFI